ACSPDAIGRRGLSARSQRSSQCPLFNTVSTCFYRTVARELSASAEALSLLREEDQMEGNVRVRRLTRAPLLLGCVQFSRPSRTTRHSVAPLAFFSHRTSFPSLWRRS